MIVLDTNKEWGLDNKHLYHLKCPYKHDPQIVSGGFITGFSYLGYNKRVTDFNRFESTIACEECWLEMPWEIQDKVLFLRKCNTYT